MDENSVNSEKNSNKESTNFPALSASIHKKAKKKNKKFPNKDINNKFVIDNFDEHLLKLNNEENYGNSINNENFQEDNQILKLVNYPFNNKNFEVISGKTEKKNKSGFGRKKKDSSEKGNHNKYTSDNLIRKCKAVMIQILSNLINKKISSFYKNDLAFSQKRKRLMKMNQFQIVNSHIEFNKSFIYKTLKEIFSQNLSTRCTTYSKDHNKKLINELLSEEDETKKNFFEEIFSLTFLDCIEHLRGSKKFHCLKNLQKYDDICEKLNGDDDYKETFRCYIDNFEIILNKKRARNPPKNKKKEKNKTNN